uniref:Uncharacterized protein n=1 Tax=Anguilla anguilla TaxID=7936 RepID=A0A0E9WTA3_ANGAN
MSCSMCLCCCLQYIMGSTCFSFSHSDSVQTVRSISTWATSDFHRQLHLASIHTSKL